MSSVAKSASTSVDMDQYPGLWEFKEAVPATLKWYPDGNAMVVTPAGDYKQVVGCGVSLDGENIEEYQSNGLDADDIGPLLLKLAPSITNQFGGKGVLVYHFPTVSMKIGDHKRRFKFNSLLIVYEGYSEIMLTADLKRKNVGTVSHGAVAPA